MIIIFILVIIIGFIIYFNIKDNKNNKKVRFDLLIKPDKPNDPYDLNFYDEDTEDTNEQTKEHFEIMDGSESVVPLSKFNNNSEYLNNVLNDQFFTSCQFHKDYIDVLNAFNDYDGLSPHDKQLFNINNIPVEINKNVKGSQEVAKIYQMINNFIKEINDKIVDSQQASNHYTANGWNLKYEQDNSNDPFRKFRRSLDLPESLYNDEVKGTKISLNKFFGITKYTTEQEMKYIVHILLNRELADDSLLVKVSFVINKKQPNNVIIENIDVIGVISTRKVAAEYSEVNKFYNFDSLDENNMINTGDLMNELAYKHLIRQKLANEQIDNLDENDRIMHNHINPYDYQSYKNTRTIYNDIQGEKKFS